MSKSLESLLLYVNTTIAIEGEDATIKLKTLKEWLES